MENLNNYDEILESIKDLVDLENIQNDSVFYRYKDRKIIGHEIHKELLARFNIPKKNARKDYKVGFSMDDSKKNIGLLSQCQGLQSLLLLTSAFGLDFATKYVGAKSNEATSNLDIRGIMDLVIEDILAELKSTVDENDERVPLPEGKYIFGATPYDTDAFDTKYAYIDCVTWVIPTFLLVLRYHVDIGEICRFEKELVSVIKSGLQYLNEAYIKSTTTEKEKKLTCGWNFTRDCEEPSLYFTFAVAECYADLFTTFSAYLKDVKAVRDSERLGIPLDAETEKRVREEKALYDQAVESGALSKIRYEKEEKSVFGVEDSYNELRRLYIAISDGAAEFDSAYGTLESNCKEVAGMVWSLVKDKFADYFYYNDLHATITEDDLRMSTTNDALFNSVYIINILLDTGLDEDINKEIKEARLALKLDETKEDELTDEDRRYYQAKLAEKTREYNNLLETCQLALQKAIRAYENLKSESREYIVDQFLVGFNEKLVKLESKVRELRKLRIRVFSLLPLFVKTNSVISEYLIKYPQSSMKKYLGYILENRYIDRSKNVSHWIWEQDGYFSASNYYYISALGEFYSYYDEYEHKYVSRTFDRESIRVAYKEELDKPNGEIGKLKEDLKKKDKEFEKLTASKNSEIAQLKEEISSRKSPIEDAVKSVINDQLKECFPKLITEFMNDVATALTSEYLEGKMPNAECKAFQKAMGDLMISFFAKGMVGACADYVVIGGDPEDSYEDKDIYAMLAKDVKDDVVDIVNKNIESISIGCNKKISALNEATDEYSGKHDN